MRSKKSRAYLSEGPGRGLIKVIRVLGCWCFALMRWIPMGMVGSTDIECRVWVLQCINFNKGSFKHRLYMVIACSVDTSR